MAHNNPIEDDHDGDAVADGRRLEEPLLRPENEPLVIVASKFPLALKHELIRRGAAEDRSLPSMVRRACEEYIRRRPGTKTQTPEPVTR